jgi:hypothetical protein
MQEPHFNKAERHAAAITAGDVSLFRGGLIYRAQLVTRLIDAEHWNLPRRVALVLAVTWLPLVIITAIFYRDQLSTLLKDYVAYSKIVVTIPVLLLGQPVMESRFRMVVTHVWEAGLLGAEDQSKLFGVLATIRRLRDSALPELIIMVLVFVDLGLIYQGKLTTAPAWAVYRVGGIAHLTSAGVYYGLVCIPIYQLLIGLSFWRWLLWSFFLFKLSRMDLKTVATHPDRHGGLGFLGLSPTAFAPVAFGLSTAIGASWRNEILNYGASLASFKLPAIILLVLIFVIALGPLTFFVYKLDILRRSAMLEYGVIAQYQATTFHEKWILHGEDPEEAHLTDSEVSALADFSTSYQNIKNLRPFPADRNTLIGLALAVLAPLFPAVLAEIPFEAIIKGLLEAVKAVPV